MSLYALNTSFTGASTGAYCSVSLTAGTLLDGVGQCMPSSLAYTYMSFQGGISYQVPAGEASVGGTVNATNSVAGSVIVSPPINVDLNVELWGNGKVLGTYVLPAGQESGEFTFSVSSADAIPDKEIGAVLEKIAKPQR
jgi:hypothetical protein